MGADLTVNVANFGPVKDGEITLKPLTIFIGPNNSGKSYMATLVYALTKALAGRFHSPFFWGLGWPAKSPDFDLSADQQQQLLEWYAEQSAAGRPRGIELGSLPGSVKALIARGVDHFTSELQKSVDETLRDYFGAEGVNSLVRGGNKEDLVINLNPSATAEPFLRLLVESGKDRSKLQWNLPRIERLRVRPNRYSPFARPRARRASVLAREAGALTSVIVAEAWRQILVTNGVCVGESYYLPAARSGILQGWQVFASIALQMVRQRVGLERIEVPPLTGVAGDFLQVLLERLLPGTGRKGPCVLGPALDVLEERVFDGEVSLDQRSTERPLILYKSGDLELPLQRVSSMVGELAPLELWMKHLVAPGELLIIDEPEAHLHPEGQRWIARVLVRLVNAGVRVLCTTHSSLILHQVSNHLLASEADEATRSASGFTQADVIKDVAVYLFDRRRDGTHIGVVQAETGFGIPEDEFLRVAESIGEETYRLSAPSETVRN